MLETINKVSTSLEQVVPTSKGVLWSIFGLVLVIYIVVSLVLLYHWRQYSLHNKRVIFAETAYFIVSISALLVAIFTLIFI